jgi:ABC-2 type transport system ATP-binding protein
MNDSLVVCQQVSKIFKDFWMRDRARAVNSLSFEIRPREIFGLLGPNGSGKSTTIKMILGLLRPTSGRIALFGKNPTDVAVKRRIGYLPDYYGKLFELDHRTRTRRIDELLDMLGLVNAQFRPVREYSKGMQRRIGIAQALINDPDLLILDEPTTGLDPLGTRQIKDLILELGRRGKTVLLSSHLLADVEDCVDRLIILYGGTKRAEGTCDDLLVSQSRTSIEADTLDEETVAEIDRLIRVRSHGVKSITKVARPRQSLEALFIDIVEKARAEVATSGAMSGGETASFLKAEEVDGDQLINRLTAVEVPATPTEAAASSPGPASGPDSGMIGSLLQPSAPDASKASSPTATPSPSVATPKAPAPVARPQEDIDTSIIGGLLGDAAGDDGSKGSGPRGGAR